MSPELAARFIDVIGALLLFTTILIMAATQIYRAVYAVAWQSACLGLAGAVLGAATHNVDLWIIAVITIALKSLFLPWLLLRVVRRVGIHLELEPVIPIAVSLTVASAVVVLSFYLGASLGTVRQAISGNALPVGVALTLLGVLIMASQRKAITQMVGLFVSENGIFFTAMAVSQGMPLIIEIGVILDVILGALVMGILVLRVRSAVDADIASLDELKG